MSESLDTEQHRHDSEVREVMRRFPKPEQITAYLEGVEKRRGSEAMERLRVDLRKAWRGN